MPEDDTITAAPSRTLAQRLEALAQANGIRSDRAALKRRIKQLGKPGGREEIAALIVETPDLLGSMKIWDLLMAAPGYGRVKTNKTLSYSRVSPSKTIGGLSSRQRLELAQRLCKDHHPRATPPSAVLAELS